MDKKPRPQWAEDIIALAALVAILSAVFLCAHALVSAMPKPKQLNWREILRQLNPEFNDTFWQEYAAEQALKQDYIETCQRVAIPDLLRAAEDYEDQRVAVWLRALAQEDDLWLAEDMITGDKALVTIEPEEEPRQLDPGEERHFYGVFQGLRVFGSKTLPLVDAEAWAYFDQSLKEAPLPKPNITFHDFAFVKQLRQEWDPPYPGIYVNVKVLSRATEYDSDARVFDTFFSEPTIMFLVEDIWFGDRAIVMIPAAKGNDLLPGGEVTIYGTFEGMQAYEGEGLPLIHARYV